MKHPIYPPNSPQKILLLLFLGSILTESVLSGSEKPPEGWWTGSEVPQLTNETFFGLVGGSKWVLVEFFTPWCIYCYNFKPDLEKLHKYYSGPEPETNRTDLEIVQVNAESNLDLKIKFKIHKYPEIILFEPGSQEAKSHFNGDLNFDSLNTWIKKKMANSQKTKSQSLNEKGTNTINSEQSKANKTPVGSLEEIQMKNSTSFKNSQENAKKTQPSKQQNKTSASQSGNQEKTQRENEQIQNGTRVPQNETQPSENQTVIVIDDPSNKEEEFVFLFEGKDAEREFEVEISQENKEEMCKDNGVDEETIELILNEADLSIGKSFKKTSEEIINKIKVMKNLQTVDLSDFNEKLAEIEKKMGFLGNEISQIAKSFEGASQAFLSLVGGLKEQLEQLKAQSQKNEEIKPMSLVRHLVLMVVGLFSGVVGFSLFQKYHRINHKHIA